MNPEPIATYRVQLCKEVTLYNAVELVPYLARLGISHIYTSPAQQTTANCNSGYEVADPSRVADDLGGEEAHVLLGTSLAQHGLGRMVDIVPNHMSIAGSDNPWWNDVLKHGKSSHYAAWFDVDWDASEAQWPNQVLLPVLSDQFGRVLEAGGFRLRCSQGEFTLHYGEATYPLEPASIAGLLAAAAEKLNHAALAFIAESLQRLPRPSATLYPQIRRRHQDVSVLTELLARVWRDTPDVAIAIEAEVAKINHNVQELGALIERQNYRLAHWRAADLDLGYRRFFNVNSLAGLRIELPEVFRAVHELPLKWIKEGTAHALRVDHPDGLRDPTHYMERLRQAVPEAWIVVEKILASDERLPCSWPVDGTTGYDFANEVQGLFIDPGGEQIMSRCYEALAESNSTYEEIQLASKHSVLSDMLGSEVSRLTSLLRAICERHWRHRDHTRAVLTQALVGILVQFKVYRTYVRVGGTATDQDREQIRYAVASARTANPQLDEELLDFIHQLLLMEVGGTLEEEFALHFQQLSGPAMAKGIEDTAFYRYFRLIALNEVGGSPVRWGCLIPHFHQWCVEAQRTRPYSMLTTSTHDTKRSEDVRARLLVLSEVAEIWMDTSRRWRELNAHHRGECVDANTEYLYYQTLVGAWPIDAERVTAYMEKAVCEGKLHTDWNSDDQTYKNELRTFIARTMADKNFLQSIEVFVQRIILPGRINSLGQTLIKLTAPGIPDIYQGCELWDLSLVDPDNRRLVDHTLSARLLAEIDDLAPAAIMARMDEGMPKLWLITTALRTRQKNPGWFGPEAAYEPVKAKGEYASHVVAFMRGGMAITVVPRLVTYLPGEPSSIAKAWGATSITLPPGSWRNCLDPAQTFTGEVEMWQLFQTVPVALLAKVIE